MKVEFSPPFDKDIRHLRDGALLARLKKAIVGLEQASSLSDLAQVKAMTGCTDRYRLRIGDYRLGLQLVSDAVLLVRFLHRKEISRHFP